MLINFPMLRRPPSRFHLKPSLELPTSNGSALLPCRSICLLSASSAWPTTPQQLHWESLTRPVVFPWPLLIECLEVIDSRWCPLWGCSLFQFPIRGPALRRICPAQATLHLFFPTVLEEHSGRRWILRWQRWVPWLIYGYRWLSNKSSWVFWHCNRRLHQYQLKCYPSLKLFAFTNLWYWSSYRRCGFYRWRGWSTEGLNPSFSRIVQIFSKFLSLEYSIPTKLWSICL